MLVAAKLFESAVDSLAGCQSLQFVFIRSNNDNSEVICRLSVHKDLSNELTAEIEILYFIRSHILSLR